ncbi:ATP-binding Cassette (ABC) Superfamily [Achlya hypogyna]|uniref:ATP-binding Cassette (ABC) Superfamily n=1 Tax=Achlya hypogyna TaxID=1202772 RepID=A0A1V9YIE8_ACHHY|nr:ATP-binding Cassette (ABC) Superfamily [Achlya hypogyna]
MTTHFIAMRTPVGAVGAEVVEDAPRLTLEWNIVEKAVHFRNPSTKQAESKTILRNVRGSALPGQFITLMGPSGAGKSSLLDILSGRVGGFDGSVTVNGHPWTTALTQCSCYVMQDDVFYHTLTVKEHLLYQADLRMDPQTSASQRVARVDTVLHQLGLSSCADSYIGNASIRGISGGERKRLSLATELLTNPSILFIDEPTSGLDSTMAESVVLELQRLAARGHTVIATIHQPSSQIFALFDRLLLLTGGETVYFGPAAEAVEYFSARGLVCPGYVNPADFFMKEIQPSAATTPLVAAWAQCTVATELPSAHAWPTVADAARRGWWGQFAVLCRRNIRRLQRDTAAFRARLAQSIVISIVSGLIYRQLPLSQSSIQSLSGALFFLTLNQGMLAATSEFVQIPLELPLMQREVDAGLYAAPVWYAAKNASEVLVQFAFPMIFLLPVFYLIGFERHSSNALELFFSMYLFLALVTSACVGVGYMVSCAVRRADVAPMIGIVTLMPFVLFGGLLVNSNDTPVYFVWLEALSPIKYGYRGLNRAFWSSVAAIPCAPGQRCAAVTGQEVLENAALDDYSLAFDALLLVAINVGFRVLGLMALLLVVRRRR